MTTPHVRVAVIGAGFAGIGAAIQLARSGERSFVVLERADSVGGTWRDNVYPGVACDIPSHLYSFSFAPKADWSRRFARGADIRAYLEQCANLPEARAHIRRGVTLHGATWNERVSSWQLDTSQGPLTASFLVLATGRFSAPHIPDIAGLKHFTGPVCHTARWNDDVAEPGTHIGVVGTGSSAAQLVPRLIAQGHTVTLFQRTAPWVIPKADAPYAAQEIAGFVADDTARAAHRQSIFDDMEAWFTTRRIGTPENDVLRARAQQHLHEQVRSPQLRRALSPEYTLGCKRIVVSDDWYPALTSPRLTLEPSALARFETDTAHPHGRPLAVATSGTAHRIDSLVFATGFEASRPEIASLVRGRSGELLSEHWRDGMVSYASTAIPGFPNCFVLGGPGSALGHNSAVAILETQIGHLLDAMQHLGDHSVCDARPEAEAAYTRMLDARAAGTVWAAGDCSSWYRDSQTGRLTLLWPSTATEYARLYGNFHAARYRISTRSAAAPATEALPPTLFSNDPTQRPTQPPTPHHPRSQEAHA